MRKLMDKFAAQPVFIAIELGIAAVMLAVFLGFAVVMFRGISGL